MIWIKKNVNETSLTHACHDRSNILNEEVQTLSIVVVMVVSTLNYCPHMSYGVEVEENNMYGA